MPAEGRRNADLADELRDTARTARRSLDPTSRASAQSALCRRLCSLPELREPGSTGGFGWYRAADGEVDLAGAVDELRAAGWNLWLPVVGPERSLSFAPWRPSTPLLSNRYGIDEPEHEQGDLVPAATLEVVVVPCVVVDPSGNRLGFGAGYYDRALATAPRTLRIGVAFEAQVVPSLDPAPWDVPLDVVVTEDRVRRPRPTGA